MKGTVITSAVLALCALSAGEVHKPCCENMEHLTTSRRCGNSTKRISIGCPKGAFLLRDIFFKGTRLFTLDSPEISFVDDVNKYCVGTMMRNESDPSSDTQAVAVVCFESADDDTNYQLSGILTLVSVVFLLLTFAIYMVLPELRDLQGKCFMSMCISMAIGFLSLGMVQLNGNAIQELCTFNGFLIYFWMMATFFWMNAVSINMYRSVTYSSYVRSTEWKQFIFYSAYAWGCSLAFLVVALVADFIEGSHLKPGFGKNSCWFRGASETWAFFYGPIAALITANIILFIMTSVKLWQYTKNYKLSTLNNLKYKFLLSLKLFIVMGVTWIFEIASFAHGKSHIVWTIADTFNCLQGVVFFLLLVVLRRRAIRGLIERGVCASCARPLLERLSPHDDSEHEDMITDQDPNGTEVRLDQ